VAGGKITGLANRQAVGKWKTYMLEEVINQRRLRLDVSIFENVMRSGSVADRMALTRQLCDLLNDPHSGTVECQQVMPIVTKLACDTDRHIRDIIASRLLKTDGLSADMVFSIVADEDDIAIPFIGLNPSLDDSIMKTILAVGDVKRCKAVAARPDLGAGSVRKIMQDGTEDVVLVLLGNAKVRLGAGYCRKIYNRFHASPKVCDVLMDLPHLPCEIALVHNQRTAEEMRKKAQYQGWVADFRSDDYISDKEEVNALRILRGVEAGKLQSVVALMSQRGMLTTSLLLRAGMNGHLPFFEWALAYLANVSLRKVRRATGTMSARTVNILLRRAGIPSDAHVLIHAICQVSAATGAMGKQADPEAFGRALVEVIMTRHAADDDHERMRIISLLSQLTQGRTRTLVSRLSEGMSRAA